MREGVHSRCTFDPLHLSSCNMTILTSRFRDADTLEIYSRGQNPQDWHLVKRGEPVVGSHNVGDVYMEIGRKEASLTDVDYELSALVRRLIE